MKKQLKKIIEDWEKEIYRLDRDIVNNASIPLQHRDMVDILNSKFRGYVMRLKCLSEENYGNK